MEWRDEAIVLSVRKHGESAAIVSLLTRQYGRHAGLVRGARSVKMRGVLQPGNFVNADWRARLAEHLGTLSVELLEARTAPLLTHRGRLAGLSSACAIVERAVPERQPVPELFDLMNTLTQALKEEGWLEIYSKWELALLSVLGFGLDLTSCAATGVTEDLTYVSPKSGRAVSREGGALYKDKLLSLPNFLIADTGSTPEMNEIRDALRLSGFFLRRHVLGPLEKQLPDERDWLVPGEEV